MVRSQLILEISSPLWGQTEQIVILNVRPNWSLGPRRSSFAQNSLEFPLVVESHKGLYLDPCYFSFI